MTWLLPLLFAAAPPRPPRSLHSPIRGVLVPWVPWVRSLPASLTTAFLCFAPALPPQRTEPALLCLEDFPLRPPALTRPLFSTRGLFHLMWVWLSFRILSPPHQVGWLGCHGDQGPSQSPGHLGTVIGQKKGA